METKAELLELLDYARTEEQRFTDALRDDERILAGEPDQWAPKDELAHVAVWKRITARHIAVGMKGESVKFYEDLDAENERLFQQYRDHDWEQVLHELDSCHKELVGKVQELPEADLTDLEKFPWLEGRDFWSRALLNGYFHPLWHIALMHAARGGRPYGNQLMEGVVRRMVSLKDTEDWRARYLYNLACYYSLVGENKKSLEMLEITLPLNPDLVEWSKKDSDLDAVRNEPGYQELVGG